MALKHGEELQRWEIAVAKKLVGEFRRRSRSLAREEFDDLLQECLAHWLEVRRKLDPDPEGPPIAYMARVIRNKLTDLLRERSAAKRARDFDTVSLDAAVSESDDARTRAPPRTQTHGCCTERLHGDASACLGTDTQSAGRLRGIDSDAGENRVSGDALKSGIANSVPATPASGTPGRHVSIEERRRLVAESLRVGNPGNNSRELPTQADPRHDCQIQLAVDDIRPYENNPRRAGNARFAEIKESIRSSGIRNPLTVTRRPGDEHFIVEAGGNTRLLAIQQLWAETRDARFQRLIVLFRPWRSESHVLTSHLIENELRGEMTFWDKASGVVALKGRLEDERGEALSLRQLEDEMKGLGLSVNTATLAHCLFAIERLRTLGQAVDDLSGLDVKTMQPRLNAMKRYAQMRAALAEADLYGTVFEPVFQNAADQYRQSRTFSASEVCGACEEALARELGEPIAHVRLAFDSPSRSSQTSPDTSLARVRADRPVESAEIPSPRRQRMAGVPAS